MAVVDAQGAVLGQGTTDDSGVFSLEANGFEDEGYVVIEARAANPPITIQDNTSNNSVWSVAVRVPASPGDYEIRIPSGWNGQSFEPKRRLSAPFAILDTAYTAAQAFRMVRAIDIPELRINWSPENSPQQGAVAQGMIGSSHYSPRANEIFVLGRDGVDTDEFDDHVIAHEWGHFYQANFGRSDSPGGRHEAGDVLDPRVSFGEGWGNAVSAIVLPSTTYIDSNWQGSDLDAFGFDLEADSSPTDDPVPGAFSESSVMRALFDLYDAPASGDDDAASFGLGAMHDAMVADRQTEGVITLGSFIEKLKQQQTTPAARSAIDSVLAKYRIGPLTSQWGDGDPGLKDMFSTASRLPFSGSISLGAGYPSNAWQQTQYYVFPGTGAAVSISATSSKDVALEVISRGASYGVADQTTSGAEGLTIQTRAGQYYVVVLTGYGQGSGDYSASVSIR